MQTLTFQNITLSPVKTDNQIWLSSADLANALGYSRSDKVTRLYHENQDEFTPSMTALIPNPKMKNAKIRIFSLRGCHLIAMFARTKVAKEFRQWVLDILDKEVGQPVQVEPKLSDEQCYQIQKAIKQKCLYNGVHYQTIYSALYGKFKKKSYKDILASDFDEAMAFIMGFEFAPAFNLALVQNILADNAHQNQKARFALDGMIGELKAMIDYADELKTRLTMQDRLIGALQTRLIG